METTEIKKIIEEVLGVMGISYKEIETLSENNGTVFMVRADDAKYLIGIGGAHLLAFNHLVRRIVEKRGGDGKTFAIDVNGYQKERNEELKNKARILAERVKSFKSEEELEPMSPYERMVVHSILAEDPEIKTESTGFGRDRRVVIRYQGDGV